MRRILPFVLVIFLVGCQSIGDYTGFRPETPAERLATAAELYKTLVRQATEISRAGKMTVTQAEVVEATRLGARVALDGGLAALKAGDTELADSWATRTHAALRQLRLILLPLEK